jgi:transcriptional antiterminator RfaH
MPLLPMEPFVFPEDLLTMPSRPLEDDARWWVLHTRPRAEKALARRILGQGLSYFLPLYKRQWRSRGRLLCSYVPAFTSYLFLRGDGEARVRALETNLVASCLPVPDQGQLESDLLRVYQLMVSGAPLSPEDRLLPGTRVEIIQGPLAGLEGSVLRRGTRLRVYVEVQFLQRGVSAEVEAWMIRPLDRPQSVGAVLS